MKLFKLTLTLILGLFFLNIPAQATTLVTTTNGATVSIEKQKTDLKKEFKAQKRAAKWEKFLKKAIDFSDPVEKWLWFAIFGLLGGIVVTWLISAPLGGLIGTAGFICLIVWIVKKFA